MFLRLYTGVTTWWNDLKVRAEEEKGATAVEYALMVALIAVVIIAAVINVSQSRRRDPGTCATASWTQVSPTISGKIVKLPCAFAQTAARTGTR